MGTAPPQTPALQTRPAVHALPAQQGWPEPPQVGAVVPPPIGTQMRLAVPAICAQRVPTPQSTLLTQVS